MAAHAADAPPPGTARLGEAGREIRGYTVVGHDRLMIGQVVSILVVQRIKARLVIRSLQFPVAGIQLGRQRNRVVEPRQAYGRLSPHVRAMIPAMPNRWLLLVL
jgi:hypothetical protein